MTPWPHRTVSAFQLPVGNLAIVTYEDRSRYAIRLDIPQESTAHFLIIGPQNPDDRGAYIAQLSGVVLDLGNDYYVEPDLDLADISLGSVFKIPLGALGMIAGDLVFRGILPGAVPSISLATFSFVSSTGPVMSYDAVFSKWKLFLASHVAGEQRRELMAWRVPPP